MSDSGNSRPILVWASVFDYFLVCYPRVESAEDRHDEERLSLHGIPKSLLSTGLTFGRPIGI